MKRMQKSGSLSNKLARKYELRLICKEAIKRENSLGRLKRPGSLRNLRRWLVREVVKREGWRAGRQRFMKAAAVILISSGMILFRGVAGVPAAHAAYLPTLTEQTGTANPFDGEDVGDWSKPGFVDIDADGDMDAFIGGKDGIIRYYQNTGSVESPVYVLQNGAVDDPFDGVSLANGYAAPAFVDIDADGDMDAFVGEGGLAVHFFE